MAFSTSGSLAVHMPVHSGEFAFPLRVQCRTMTQWRKALLDQLAAVLEEYDLPESIDVNVLVQDSAPRQRVASNDAGAHEDESDAQRSAGCLFNLRIKPAAYAASATSRPVDRFLRQGRARAPRADDDDLFDNRAGRTTTSRREERLARFLRECSPPPRTSRSAAEPEIGLFDVSEVVEQEENARARMGSDSCSRVACAKTAQPDANECSEGDLLGALRTLLSELSSQSPMKDSQAWKASSSSASQGSNKSDSSETWRTRKEQQFSAGLNKNKALESISRADTMEQLFQNLGKATDSMGATESIARFVPPQTEERACCALSEGKNSSGVKHCACTAPWLYLNDVSAFGISAAPAR